MSANIKTHLHCFHGSVVAVRVSPATALVDVGDPTDAEMEAAYASDPEGTRALSDYLNEHNKDGGAYKRLKIGFGAED